MERWTFDRDIYEWYDSGSCDIKDQILEGNMQIEVCDSCSHTDNCPRMGWGGWKLLDPRIPVLETENKRLREALENLIVAVNNLNHTRPESPPAMLSAWRLIFMEIDRSRAALEGKEPS